MITKHLFALILSLLLISCKENSIENNGVLQHAILMESGFESNNQPILTGWRDNDTIITNRRRFSQDVPSGGGKWSIQIFPPFNGACMSMSYTVYPMKNVQSYNYKLTYWRKTSEGDPNSTVWLDIYYGGFNSGNGRGVSPASDWVKDSIIYNSQNNITIDSIKITINGCSKTPIRPDSLNNVFYDMFKLEQY